MSQLTDAFKRAWHASDKEVSEEQAMQWFFAGVAAQKEAIPPVRFADAEAFAQQRHRAGHASFRPDATASSREGQLFLDIIRNLNYENKLNIKLVQQHVDQGAVFLSEMAADGAKWHQLTANNLAKGRDNPYRFYKGYTGLRTLLDGLVRQYATKPVGEPLTS